MSHKQLSAFITFIKDRKYLWYSKFIQIMAYNLKAHEINIYLKTHEITWYSTKLDDKWVEVWKYFLKMYFSFWISWSKY